MALQIVVMVMAMVGCVRTWPITELGMSGTFPFLGIRSTELDRNEPPASPTIIAMSECGQSEERGIAADAAIQVVFNVTDTDFTASECQIFLRVYLTNVNLATYGLRVSGDVHVLEDDCRSSSLLLHDNDDATDNAAISKKFCKSGPIEYRTLEDVIIFSYKQRRTGAGGWQGASLTLTPELVCGGDVEEDTILKIPDHFDIKAPFVCNWRLMPGEGQILRLFFDDFKLAPPKRTRCTTESVNFIPGDMTHYCGKKLQSKKIELSGEQIVALRVDSRSALFTCKVTFV